MRKERKHFTPEEKVAILRRHLVDKVHVSELCEELGLRPTVFYRWQKELFENGAAAFQAQERPQRQVEEKQKRIEFLEKKMQTYRVHFRVKWIGKPGGKSGSCGLVQHFPGKASLGLSTTLSYPRQSLVTIR